MIAYCWASGEIEFAPDEESVPTGAIAFADSSSLGLSDGRFKQKVKIRSRQSYDGSTYLVPGIPEANDQVEAMEALSRWSVWAFSGQKEVS